MGWTVEVEREGWARTGGSEWSRWRGDVLYTNEEHTLLFGFSLPLSLCRWVAPSEMVWWPGWPLLCPFWEEEER